jgi:hypothetical protein
VQVALDACNGEWIINEGSFTCGASITQDDLNSNGYPDSLGNPLDAILKNATAIGWTLSNGHYKGPASNSTSGATTCKSGKPCKTRHWEYDSTNGTFLLVDD